MLRAIATSSPTAMMQGALQRKICTSNQNALAIEPNVRRKTAQSKNDFLTFCHPDVFGSNHTMSPMTTAVDVPAIAVLRIRWRRSYSWRRARVDAAATPWLRFVIARDRAPARERPSPACVAGERNERSLKNLHRCERPSASEGAATSGLRGRGTP